MKKNKNEELISSEKLAAKAESFFAKNYKLIAIICIAIVVVVAIVAIATAVINNNRRSDAEAVYDLEVSYNEIIMMDESAEDYQSSVDAFLSDADELIAKGGESYPVIKAEYLKGLYYFYDGDYPAAQSSFESVADKGADTYLGPLALANAAAAAENNGDQDTARDYYNRIWDDYGTDAAESPKALFNVARIYEAQGDIELARATYQQLIDQYTASQSEYAKLAASRVVSL